MKITNSNLPEQETDVTLKVTLDSNTSKTTTFKVKKAATETCDATASLTNIEVPGGNTITSSTTSPIIVTSNFNVTSTKCTTESHKTDTNHGYSVQWSLTSDDENINNYASVAKDTGVLTITPANLPATEQTATLTATVWKDGQAVTPAITKSVPLTFQKEGTCAKKPTGVTVTTQTLSPLDFTAEDVTGSKAQTVTFTPSITWDTGICNINNHESANHGAQIAWTAKWDDGSATGLTTSSSDSNFGVTINPAQLPNYTNTLTVTASIGGVSGSANITVERPQECDKQITAITGITAPTNGTSISVSTGTTNYQYSVADTQMTITGSCEFGNDTHNGSQHNIKWRITTNAVNGINISESGLLTVDASQLTRGTTHNVTIRAYVDGKADTVYKDLPITITRTSSTSGNTGSSDDNDDSDSRQWESIRKEIRNADRGDTIKVRLGSNTELPAYVLRQLDGENVTLQMTVSGGYVWTVNGKSVKRIPSYQIYIPLDVEEYSNSRMLKLCRDYDVEAFQLRHTGSFYSDMKLTIDVGSKYAKDTLYLYSYNEDTNKLTYRSSAKADSDGEVTFTLTSSAGNYVITSKALYGESAVSGGGGTISSSSSSRPASSSTYVPPASSAVSSSSSSSSSSESSSESSEPEPPVEPSSSSQEESEPTDTQPQEDEEKGGIPVLVPILIIAIAGVITATVLIVRGSGKNRGGSDSDDDFDD